VRHGAGEDLNMAPTDAAPSQATGGAAVNRAASSGPGGENRRPSAENTGIFGAGGNLPGGGTSRRPIRFAPEESWGKVIAMDPLTGTARWEHKTISPPWSGVMATGGNLVFGGTIEGVVFALDSRTGQRLWYFEANDRVYASPISYLVDGKQYVSLPVGDVLITFGL
jgi:outer membrane protein assembly factor BamB